MSGKGNNWKPIELRADRLRCEERERRQNRHELMHEQEIDLFGRVFAESVGHDLGLLCMLSVPDGKGKPTEDGGLAAQNEERENDPLPLSREETSGWGNVTGHGC